MAGVAVKALTPAENPAAVDPKGLGEMTPVFGFWFVASTSIASIAWGLQLFGLQTTSLQVPSLLHFIVDESEKPG